MTAVKVEGIDYFADTLLFAGTILAVASAAPAGYGAPPLLCENRPLRQETASVRDGDGFGLTRRADGREEHRQ